MHAENISIICRETRSKGEISQEMKITLRRERVSEV